MITFSILLSFRVITTLLIYTRKVIEGNELWQLIFVSHKLGFNSSRNMYVSEDELSNFLLCEKLPINEPTKTKY